MAHLFASVLTSLRKGDQHSNAVMAIWNDYPVLDQSQPYRDVPVSKRNGRMQKEVAHWAAGRKALTQQVLVDMGLDPDLSVEPTKPGTTHPCAAAAQQQMKRPVKPQVTPEQLAAEEREARVK